jgi:hypothetical protein
LERDSIEPPDTLLKKIFPELENLVEEWESSSRCTAAKGCLKAFKWFRTVILQDAAMLQNMGIYHSMWAHPVFNGDDFLKFRELMKATMMEEDRNAPRIVLMQRVVPLIERELRKNNQLIIQQSEINRNFIKSELDNFREVNVILIFVCITWIHASSGNN